MMPPTSIDGTDITGATIDGTDVTEITVDGQTVFSSSFLPANTIHNYDATTLSGADGSTVTTWEDTVGSDDLVDDGGAFSAPSLTTSGINGVNSVEFDGSEDLFADSLSTKIQTPFTAFLVYDVIDDGNRQSLIHDESITMFLRNRFDNNDFQYFFNSNFTASQLGGGQFILTITHDSSGNVDIRANGTDEYSFSSNTGDFQNLRVGGLVTGGFGGTNASGKGHNGQIGQIIFVDGVLSTASINTVESQLSTKWGISV